MSRAAQGCVVGNQSFAIKIVETIVHQGHALFAPGLDCIFELMQLILTNQVTHSTVRYDELIRENPACAIRSRKEFLGNYPLKRIAKLEDDLTLRASFENADYTLQGM